MSLTKLSLAGNNLIITARESLVIDIPAEDGKIIDLFYSKCCAVHLLYIACEHSVLYEKYDSDNLMIQTSSRIHSP
jgi:hypothetical protein